MTGGAGSPVRLLAVVGGVTGPVIALAASLAGAQEIGVNFPQGGGLTERILQMIALLTVL